MMKSINYISGTKGDTLYLNGADAISGTPNAFLTYGYTYDTDFRGISNVSLDAKETEINTIALSCEKAASMAQIFSQDVENGKPGQLLINGEWFTSVYITGYEPVTVGRNMISLTLTIVFVDSQWRRGTTFNFIPQNSSVGEGLNYPHNYPHNYKLTNVGASLVNPSKISSDFKLIIYGQATEPYIIIGGNRYEVKATVPEGGYLVVDCLNKASIGNSIYTVAETGEVTNVFNLATRGSGEGSGEYIFEQIKSGYNEVAWNNLFGFDLTLYERVVVPPCIL